MDNWRRRIALALTALGFLCGGRIQADDNRPGGNDRNVRFVVPQPCVKGVSYHHMASSPFHQEATMATMPPMPDDVFKSGSFRKPYGVDAQVVAPDPSASPPAVSPEEARHEPPGYAVLVPGGESVAQAGESHPSLPPPPPPPAPLMRNTPPPPPPPAMPGSEAPGAEAPGAGPRELPQVPDELEPSQSPEEGELRDSPEENWHGACDSCYSVDCRGECGRHRLFGIQYGGWIDQGVTVNGRRPLDRFNGPVTFNDRDSEYQLNQAWFYAEKETWTGGWGLDIGGRIDFVYGTDSRFTQATGLDDQWDTGRFYGAALPQIYADVAVNNLTVRMGHYFTILGYESVPAVKNFFYSHSYTHQYGEPFTHTGLLTMYELGENWLICGGFDRGWDDWDDNNGKLDFLGGITFKNYEETTALAFAITTGPYDDAAQYERTVYSLVASHQVTDRLTYVFQHDLGIARQGGFPTVPEPAPNAEWYSINQYLLFQMSEVWGFGGRIEWFRDDDGARVGGMGAPHGWTLGPDFATDSAGWAGNFFEATLGLNWRPTRRVNVRGEVRWDWYDGPVNGAGQLPYDFGASSNQFTFATDVIWTY